MGIFNRDALMGWTVHLIFFIICGIRANQLVLLAEGCHIGLKGIFTVQQHLRVMLLYLVVTEYCTVHILLVPFCITYFKRDFFGRSPPLTLLLNLNQKHKQHQKGPKSLLNQFSSSNQSEIVIRA